MPRLALFLLALLALALPAAAQDTPAPGCTRLDFAGMFSEAAYLLEADESSDDPALLDSMLTHILTTIQQRRAECAGLHFTGESGSILGPFTLPAGTWIFAGTFNYYSSAEIVELDDDCRVLGGVLGSMEAEAGTDESVVEVNQDCRVVIEVNAEQPWALTFAALQ